MLRAVIYYGIRNGARPVIYPRCIIFKHCLLLLYSYNTPNVWSG
jgi:hypothetical protein